MTFSLFLWIQCLCLSKEQVFLYLIITDHAVLPREERRGGSRTESRRNQLSTWHNTKQSERLRPTHFCRQTNQRGKALNPPKLQPGGNPKEQCTFLLTSQVWKHHAKRLVKIPYHAVQPSSEAQHIFCSVEGCARSWTEQRKRKMEEMREEEAQQSPQECFWVLNKWETPLGIQTNQSLSYRTSFSHSGSVEKTAANQARDYGIGMQQRAAMRFVGGLLAPSESAVSCFQALRWAAEVHHHCVTVWSTQGEATSAQVSPRGAAWTGPWALQIGKRACWWANRSRRENGFFKEN